MNATRKCSITGCERKVVAWGWCDPHYRRWRRHGDPTAGITYYSSPEEAFAAKTKWRGECLEWTGSRMSNGYGTTTVKRRNQLAHRWAWEEANGPIPAGMEVDHACHNRACVNIAHLRLATPSQNNSNQNGPFPGTPSGARNVYPTKCGRRWRVYVGKGGKSHYFGTYTNKSEAIGVAEHARKELFGEYAGKG